MPSRAKSARSTESAPKGDAPGESKECPEAYLDNAATTMMPPKVIDAMVAWTNRGNASASYAGAALSRQMMDEFRQYIADQCSFDLDGPDGFAILFTSSGSEGNCHILTAAARAFAHQTGKMPHLIVSAVEHHSTASCAARLALEKLAQLTIVPVQTAGDEVGRVDPYAVEAAIRPNTCLVSVMAANNETGILNDIAMIGVACRAKGVPFHSDAVQVFGKDSFRPNIARVDAFTVSFHKLHGPPGVGVLAVRNKLVEGYGLGPLVCGTQNGGLRGGTENIPGIGASFAATKLTFAGRAEKSERTARLREAVRAAVGSRFPTFFLEEYRTGRAKKAITRAGKGGPAVVVWIAPKDPQRLLPGTLLLTAYRPRLCNWKTRSALEKRGVVVSTGSACSSADRHSSATVEALDLPAELKSGVLRVSLGDDSTTADIKLFVKALVEVLESDECLLPAAEESG